MARTPAPTPAIRLRRGVVLAAVVAASVLGALAVRPGSPSAGRVGDVIRATTDLSSLPTGHHQPAGLDAGGGATADDGALPDGVSVFDDTHPGITRLDPDLLEAVREAARDAADEGIDLTVNSGWRSARYQDQLRREAVAEYGSEAEAARWVASADRSVHVSGDAVDLGPPAGARWVDEHGARYGLCRIYDNEPWHVELRPEAVGGRCPPRYPDAAHDPRLQPS